MIIKLTLPKECIGKWCAVENYRHDGSYDILYDNIFFISEEQGELFLANRFRFLEDYHKVYRIVQITESYPVWQAYLDVCGSSVEDLKQNLNANS